MMQAEMVIRDSEEIEDFSIGIDYLLFAKLTELKHEPTELKNFKYLRHFVIQA